MSRQLLFDVRWISGGKIFKIQMVGYIEKTVGAAGLFGLGLCRFA